MALVFTDMVGSVDMKKRVGDCEFARMLQRHDELFKSTIGVEADYVKDTGDGFLVTCASANRAVSAALAFQHAMAREPWSSPLRVRIGIHLGEVQTLGLEGSGLPKLSGLAVDVAGRIMSLADGGQILLTKSAFESAKQYVREHPPVGPSTFGGKNSIPDLRWKAHGLYMFRGLDEPVEVYEVGAVGIAPLKQPPDSEKVKRACAIFGNAKEAAGRGGLVRKLASVVALLAVAGGVFAAYRHFGGGVSFALARSQPVQSPTRPAQPKPAPDERREIAKDSPAGPERGAAPPPREEPRRPGPPPQRAEPPRRPGGPGPEAGRGPVPGPRDSGGRDPRDAGPRPSEPPMPGVDPSSGLVQVRMTPSKVAGRGARFNGVLLNRDEYAQLRLKIKPPPGVPEPTYELRVDPVALVKELRFALDNARLPGFEVRLIDDGRGGASGLELSPPEGIPGEEVERARRLAQSFVLDRTLVTLAPPH